MRETNNHCLDRKAAISGKMMLTAIDAGSRKFPMGVGMYLVKKKKLNRMSRPPNPVQPNH
jgi:hypothetical protein